MKKMRQKNKGFFVSILLIATAFVAFGSTFLYVRISENMNMGSRFTVVTSCNPVYMATLNVCDGLTDVEVVNLSQPTTGCLHDYSLTTGDMKLLANADVFVINGGGMEGFLSDVMAAYPELEIVEASNGLEFLEEDEESNSHCWMSVRMYKEQVENIASSLAALDAKNTSTFIENAKAYEQVLDEKLLSMVDGAFADMPVVIFHEAFAYVAEDFGLAVVGDMDLDEERQVSAGELHDMVELVLDENVGLIIAEESYGAKMAELVCESTGAETVYLDPMIRGDYNKDSYIEIMKNNIVELKGWLEKCR